jgi:hypothetical protein
MQHVNMAMPVLPGKEDDARAFAKAIVGARRAEFDLAQAEAGITRETWTLHPAPSGTMLLVWFECDDVEAALSAGSAATDDFGVWFQRQVKNVTGFDMTAEDGPAPPSETLVDWIL